MNWVSVYERLPDKNGIYLVFTTKSKFGKGEDGCRLIRWRMSTNPKRKGNYGFWGNCDQHFYERLTHWAEINPPPNNPD